MTIAERAPQNLWVKASRFQPELDEALEQAVRSAAYSTRREIPLAQKSGVRSQESVRDWILAPDSFQARRIPA